MKKIFIIIICKLFFICNIMSVNANIGDIGHWRDGVGGQIPGTIFGGFSFNSEIRNDGIYTKPNDSTVEITEAGDYLIITTTHDEDTSNGKYNPQLTISQIAGTGEVFSSNYTGYSRDNSENESWTRGVGIVIGASANSQFQVQKRRDTDAPTGGSVINSSDIQIVKIDKTNYGIYNIGGSNNIYGGTTPNTVDITSILNESDTASIEGNTTSDTITIKGDNKTYLLAWSVSFDSGSTRTQRIGHLEYDNTDSLSTRSYCYIRNASNEYCGLGSMDVIRTNTADINIQTEIYRGDGVAADQGGANVDGNLATDGNGQIIILEMHDTLEIFNSEDSVGLQDITAAQTLNIARDVITNDASSFTKASDTSVNVVNASDIFSWASIWTARSNISAGQRQTSYGSIVIDGIEQTTGRHGNYSRGNQGTIDTFAMGFHPAGIFTTTGAGVTLGVNSDPLAGGEAGGNDRTQPGTLGFFAINLDTLTPPPSEPILGVTFSDNDVDNTVNTNQVVKYSIDIQNTGTNATGITAVAPIHSSFGTPYGFSYVNCGSATESFTLPNLNFSNISVLGGNTCNIEYYVQVDSGASDGSTITSSIDVSSAVEGGNDPANINGDNLTVQACGTINNVNIEFVTDNWGYETFWSLTPNGNACGVGEIVNGGNTTELNCASGGGQVATNGNGYANNSTINEGPFSLNIGTQYDLHIIDDWGDGMTSSPDAIIQQNGSTTDTFVVNNNGGVFTFTVLNIPACSDTINPEVTINQANSQSDPTTINNITYSVIFDEPINIGTFTIADISITGTTGTITSGPTEVSPFNGTSFDFIVSGMTNGDVVTATIPAGGIEDLLGNTNNISTSIDNQVTYNGVPSSPGGVSSSLQIWLKSNVGTSTTTDGNSLTTWNDQSGNGFDAGGGTSPIYIDNVTDNLNFHPVVDFNGTTQYLENLANGAYSQSYFAVIVPDQQVDGTLTGQVPFGFDCNSGTLSSGTCGLQFSGLVLGSFTIAINDEVITHAIGSSTRWRSAQIGTASYQASKPMLINMNENTSATGTEISEEGVILDNFNANTYQTLSAADYNLGRSPDPAYNFYYDGKIVEIINYNSRVTSNEKQKIESYLSLKYGLTLNSGIINYLASDSTTFWSTSTAGTYINDIFGIGRDDSSELGQIKSKSISDDNIITINAVGEGTNASPSFVDMNNLEFLTISNDDGSSAWTAIGAPSGYYNLTRKWRVQEIGEVGTVDLDFDVANTGFDVPVTSSGTTYYYVYDSDNDNSLADETPQAMTNTTGNIWQIAGTDIDTTREFTIATQSNTNNLPTNITLSNNTINENSASGSTIGTFTTTDADVSDTHTYSFVIGTGDDDNSKFTITGNTLKIAEVPDYEFQNTYNVRIETDDGNGGTFEKAFSININDVGEAINTIIDFEELSDENYYTVTSGTWTRTTNNPNEGLYSNESDNGGLDNTQSCFETDNTFSGTGTINFDYEVSSEVGDYLAFYIDNVEQISWSGAVSFATYTKTDITSGTHTYKWCYVKDTGGSALGDNAFVDYITFEDTLGTDSTPPTISSINYASGTLLPGGNHNIIINYSDLGSGIDITSDTISLNKWDGSIWGPDISATGFDLGSKVITITGATYPTNSLDFGKYKYDFSISDISTNTSSTGAVFYIDEPEIEVSSGTLDIGDIKKDVTKFSSGALTITVRTVGAGFDVILNKDALLLDGTGSIEIIDWNTVEGVGYDQDPYTSTISLINTNEIIATQTGSINIDGNKNIYIYNVKIGSLVGEEQTAGDYEGFVRFGIDLDY